MATPTQQNLIASNEKYASTFTQGHLPLPPAKKYLVITCMDARIDPAAAYGISLGDAHVIRNAGGNAQDSLRSVIISQQLLGTKEIILVKHTGCGMLTFKNDDVYGVLEKNLGSEARREVGNINFQPFPNLEPAVRNDVEWLRSQKSISKEVVISGWVYDVQTGKVKQVV